MKGRGSWVVAAACLAAAAILFGGCGSSNSSSNADATTTGNETKEASSVPTGPLTKAEFVKEANRICHQGLSKKDTALSAAINELPPATKKNSREAAAKVAVLAILGIYGEIIEQLAELSPPKEDEAGAKLIVQKYEAAMEGAEKDPTSALNENPFQAGDKAAETYGVTSCIL